MWYMQLLYYYSHVWEGLKMLDSTLMVKPEPARCCKYAIFQVSSTHRNIYIVGRHRWYLFCLASQSLHYCILYICLCVYSTCTCTAGCPILSLASQSELIPASLYSRVQIWDGITHCVD